MGRLLLGVVRSLDALPLLEVNCGSSYLSSGVAMPQWTEKQLEEFSALIKREREALNEFEHLMRLVRDQSESLETIQPRIQELLKTVSETTTRLQSFLEAAPGK
jgi:hypothetical protein